MAKFLELTELETGKKMLVNIDHVLTIAPHLENNTKIELGNEVLFVREHYEDEIIFLMSELEKRDLGLIVAIPKYHECTNKLIGLSRYDNA